MKCAYADPPYLGCGKLYAAHHADALAWDDPETHRALLKTILPMCPDDCRVSPWVKPFAVFKPNVGVAYAWEPVIWRGGRRRTRQQDTARDWVSANITLKRGLTGAKPRDFSRWIFEVLNLQHGDDLVDLFPGTGAVRSAWQEWIGEQEDAPQGALV